jgi:hypothetical protein
MRNHDAVAQTYPYILKTKCLEKCRLDRDEEMEKVVEERRIQNNEQLKYIGEEYKKCESNNTKVFGDCIAEYDETIASIIG